MEGARKTALSAQITGKLTQGIPLDTALAGKRPPTPWRLFKPEGRGDGCFRDVRLLPVLRDRHVRENEAQAD